MAVRMHAQIPDSIIKLIVFNIYRVFLVSRKKNTDDHIFDLGLALLWFIEVLALLRPTIS
jgi:hypothetical protein